AVDVFVYDTSKDSDGGAWRTGDLAQASSWYNETLNTATRGSRREFPAVAVIVAEATKVTIYDGDDPSLPMWMVFNQTAAPSLSLDFFRSGRNASCVYAINGQMCFGTKDNAVSGLCVVPFIKDDLAKYTDAPSECLSGKSIANRNLSVNMAGNSCPAIVQETVNDVAMTVLPDAPIDPATGLPVPTIAVATAGGVSVIKDDGTVVDSSQTVAMETAFFTSTGLWFSGATGTRLFYASNASLSADGFSPVQVGDSDAASGSFPLVTLSEKGANCADHIAIASDSGFQSAVPGLMLHQPNYTDQSKGMSALTTSTYNTGWMNGDIKFAGLSDTDDTDLVGSGELVTNGDFATGDLTGWADPSSGWSVSGNAAVMAATGDYKPLTQDLGLTAGVPYVITFDVTAISGTMKVALDGSSPGVSNTSINTFTATGTYSFTVTPSSGETYILFARNAPTTSSVTIDNISVKLADADRSVNNNGLVVSGSITRSPVAPGAELVAYSGFSASNYLEQPYNADLDFGTGDFCVMGWVKTGASGGGFFMERGGSFFLRLISGALRFGIGTDTLSGAALTNTGWRFVCAGRASGQAFLYLDGALESQVSNSEDIDGTTPSFFFGSDAARESPAGNTNYALLRISATAPTAEQIAKIYEDELPLFQEKAACTLAGSGDAVTALTHDPTTGVLRAAQSDKTILFLGLERVGEEDGKATCIAASNGIVAGI
ncbi:MAG: LamG-like jellyroll fold domain-containing protein, partial [Phaeobacter gallaeciensis]